MARRPAHRWQFERIVATSARRAHAPGASGSVFEQFFIRRWCDDELDGTGKLDIAGAGQSQGYSSLSGTRKDPSVAAAQKS
jgi:hypothetical protein